MALLIGVIHARWTSRIAVAWLVMLAVWAVPDSSEAHMNGQLFRYVLSGAHDAPAGRRIADDACIPDDVKKLARRFGERAQRVRSRLVPPPNGIDPDGKDGFLGRQALERAIVAVIDVPGIEREAAAYARNAVDYYEYEGLPDGPLAEAAYAEQYLAKHPGTRLAPFLHFYLASRYRIAFETQLATRNKGAARSARLYRRHIRGVGTGGLLIRWAAADLDGVPYVYMQLPADAPHPSSFGLTQKERSRASID